MLKVFRWEKLSRKLKITLKFKDFLKLSLTVVLSFKFQIESLKDVVALTKDMLMIREIEVRELTERME